MHHRHPLETSIEISDASQLAPARRSAMRAAADAGLDEACGARAALIVSELGSNILKYGGGGVLTLARNGCDGQGTLDILALDQGVGIDDLSGCMRDGHSTGGSLGIGLGAVRRAASLFDVYSLPGKGVALLARVQAARGCDTPTGRLTWGSRQTRYPGQAVCGDAWACRIVDDIMWVTVIDGLGHGPHASSAADQAVASFDQSRDCASPADIMERAHSALRDTRGAAMAVAMIDPGRSSVRFAGVGNIACVIHDDEGRQHLMSQEGTVGYGDLHVREREGAWPPRATIIMHSDGLSSRCSPSHYSGLLAHHPALIAGVLHRDFARNNDDATALVIQGS